MIKLATLDATLDKFYPVGSIYMSLDKNFNPNESWGGEWQLIKSGKFLEATEIDEEVGREVEPGLPNITGRIENNVKSAEYNFGGEWASWSQKGALSSTKTIQNRALTDISWSGGAWLNSLDFDARKSNTIYGSSSTVQPSAIRLYMWQRLA